MLSLENAPAIHLGDSETQVRDALKTHAPLYPTPFSAGRSTLKAGEGLFVDFSGGKVVEIDVTSKSQGVHLGAIALGTDTATARTTLGIPDVSASGVYTITAQGGEIVELRSGASQRVDVIAIVGDRSHLQKSSKTTRITLQNTGR
jgi:hypothetical protein